MAQKYIKNSFIGLNIEPEIAEKFNSETEKQGYTKSGLIRRWILDFLNSGEKIVMPEIV